MSVSLNEVLIAAGYDIENSPEDAQWLLAQHDEFVNELCDIAEQTLDDFEEYEEYFDSLGDDDHHQAVLSFEDWRKENK